MVDLRNKLGKTAGQLANVPSSEGVRFHWPSSAREQYDYLETWHAVAMQIAGNSTPALKVLAVIPLAFRRDAGALRETDQRLADRAGYSARSISRGIAILKKAGLLSIENKSRWNGDRTVTERTCFLSFPSRLHQDVSIPDFEESVTDNGCLSRPESVADNSCLHHSESVTDNSCPSGADNGWRTYPVPEVRAARFEYETQSKRGDTKTVAGGGGHEAPSTPDRLVEQDSVISGLQREFGELGDELRRHAILFFDKGASIEEITERIRYRLLSQGIQDAG